jgi:hypothetical protein
VRSNRRDERGSAFSHLNPATLWLLAALAVAAAVAAAFVLVRSGSGTPAGPAKKWVAVGSLEEIEGRDVVYEQEHELFVLTMVAEPEGFVALSARIPAEMGGGGPRRVLYCTLSNLFENEHGDVYNRAGHLFDGQAGAEMSRIPLRVRNGVVEVAPTRATRNDLDRATYSTGPPCGEWGDVKEGPQGYALATDAPASENRARIQPTRLKVGQRAELHFARGPASGLRWDLYRLEENGLWQWRGILVGGPGYKTYFDLAPLDPGGGIDDIAFGFRYSIDIQIPKLDPGTYRLATHSVDGGSRPVHERTDWHYADFEVVPG